MSPIRKTVRATSASLYRPKVPEPPPGYRVHDPEEWGPPRRRKSRPTELRDVDYHSRHSGFGFMLDKLVRRTKNATGGGAVHQQSEKKKNRPSSAAPVLGEDVNSKEEVNAKKER